MSGHVNMMDDVLITQLPPLILRSALRALISQGQASQKVFVDHVRKRLMESPPGFPHFTDLFDETNPTYPQFLASIRCLFTSKMAAESLPYLTHFLKSISQARVRWTSDSELELALAKACGDMVQAIQALKESRPPRTEELRNRLRNLRRAEIECIRYTAENGLSCPFIRARLQVDDVLFSFFPESAVDISHYPPELKQPNWTTITTDARVASVIERTALGNLMVPRLFNGLWQMSSPAWGSALSTKQNDALAQVVKVGLLATDMADHYGDAELIYGHFRAYLPPEVANTVIAATKWCVFRAPDVDITSHFVLAAVQERSKRLGGRVELLQFHWYNYANKDYLRILTELVKITKTHPHLVSNIGLCNFDAKHTEEACLHILSELGEPGLVSNQVQYSLVDSRPSVELAGVCVKYGVKLLTYGSLCGGFLASKWLDAAAPDIYSESTQLTPSQRKYFDMISTWGSWYEFQVLLRILKSIADKYNVELANVATRWVLDRPEVGAVIIGARLGVSSNVESNLKAFAFKLDGADKKTLDDLALRKADELHARIGDCGHEYQ